MEVTATKRISVTQAFSGRQILVTGATGFLGKVFLAMMLDRLPHVGCIYVLIRKTNRHSCLDRFIEDILSSPPFQILHHKFKNQLSEFIAKRIKIIEGDVTLPNLGIEESSSKYLKENLDLMINIAGLVDFFPDVRRALSCNVDGALNAAEFVSQCQKAALMHVSTCYVAGNKDGNFAEQVIPHQNPNNCEFDAENELQLVNELIQNLITKKDKSLPRRLIELGEQRAKINGWCNTYVYSKSLAESLLVKRYPNLRLTIVRPSIIESAMEFPFAGWNEGYNTTAPLCYVIGRWLPFFVGNQNLLLDMIPVDLVCRAMLVIGAAQINQCADPVYQLSTSQQNPCTLRVSIDSVRAWHRKANRWKSSYLITRITMRCVSRDHWFAPQNVSMKLHKIASLLNDKFSFVKPAKKKLQDLARDLERTDKVYMHFLPFIYQYQYVFQSEAIFKFTTEENEFLYNPKQIKWKDYLTNTHCPGLNQWVFSLTNGRPPEKKTLPLFFTQEEKLQLNSLVDVCYAS